MVFLPEFRNVYFFCFCILSLLLFHHLLSPFSCLNIMTIDYARSATFDIWLYSCWHRTMGIGSLQIRNRMSTFREKFTVWPVQLPFCYMAIWDIITWLIWIVCGNVQSVCQLNCKSKLSFYPRLRGASLVLPQIVLNINLQHYFNYKIFGKALVLEHGLSLRRWNEEWYLRKEEVTLTLTKDEASEMWSRGGNVKSNEGNLAV